MRDPLELIRFESDAHASELGARTMVIALGGLVDAGNTQRQLVQHLLANADPAVVASFDIDQLLDYRGRRPMMTFDRDRFTSYEDPSLNLYRMTDDEGTPFLLLVGPEPDYQWERVCEAVLFLTRRLGVQLVIGAHGIPMAVPHTRPVGMTRYATDSSLIPDNDPVFGSVQIPGSLEQLLHYRLGEHGVDAIGFALHVPHYLAAMDFGDATVAALDAIVGVTGLSLPVTELAMQAELNRAEIARQIEANPEVMDVVQGIEQQYDAFQEGRQRQNLLATELAELPSADEIGAEFEEFLRTESESESDDSGQGEE